MSAFKNISIMQGCHLYCVKDCHTNTYIQNVIKHDVLPSYDRTNRCFHLINREEESSKVSSVVSVSKPDYVEKMSFKSLPPKGESKESKKKKKKKKKKKRSKRREETVSSRKHIAPIIDYDNSDLDDVLMPVIMIGKSTLILILKIVLVPILKIMRLIIILPLVLSMFLLMMICLMNMLWKIAILSLMMILNL
jgi:hypothetical protein